MFLHPGPITATTRPLTRSPRRTWPLAVFVISGLCALTVGVPGAGAAASSGQTTFTFTGTVKGTLSEPDTACSEQTVTVHGATFMLTGALTGAPATKWTIQLYNPKAGTSKKFGQESGNGPSVTLIGTDDNGNQNWNWTTATKNGSITTTKTSGKVSTTMGPYSSFRGKAGKGHVHVTGSWGCTS